VRRQYNWKVRITYKLDGKIVKVRTYRARASSSERAIGAVKDQFYREMSVYPDIVITDHRAELA